MFFRFVNQSPGGLRLSPSICVGLALSAGLGIGFAQNTVPSSSYSSTPASSGMTTNSSNPTEREIEMMQIRSAAQQARGEAAAAQISRSADQAMEERHMEATLQDARETKRLKRDAQNRIKWQKAQNAYNKITADEMSTWRGSNGGVRVERNVPNEFLLQLREEERAIAAENAAQQEEDSGFAPLAATKKMLSWRPFSGRGEENANATYTESYTSSYADTSGQQDSGGFMSNLRMPRLPLIGGGRADDAEQYAPSQAQPAAAQAPAAAAPRTVPVSATITQPGSVPRISGAELVDGRSTVNRQVEEEQRSQQSPGSSPQPTYSPSYVQAGEPQFSAGGEEEKKEGGFFSFLKSDDSGGGFGSGGGFSFGKKKEPRGGGGIDASLFPTESVYTQPTGGELGTTDPDPVEDEPQQYASAPSSVEMPSNSADNSRGGGGGFSIPKPNLSIPKIGGGNDSGGGSAKPAASANSIINSNGNSYYVISSSAQFMQYGESQMDSEIRALQPGIVVRMTKPGADWVGVQLPDGSQGVIQMKNLRAASGGEVPAGF